MKRTLLLSLTTLVLSGIAQPANLVTNGSFEEGLGGIGSFSGWQTALGDAATFVDSSGQTGTHAGQASAGLWSAYFGSTAASGGSSISQTLTTTVNQTYVLTFDLANDNGGVAASNSFLASIGGNVAFSAVNLPARDYGKEQLLFTAASTATSLVFAGFNDQNYTQLDNIDVSAVPEPASVGFLLIGLLAIGSTARALRGN